jgi:hypothetical protein
MAHDAFWPFYLHEHAHRSNRALHLAGTSLAFLFLLAGVILLQPWFLLGAALAGYAFAWTGHLFFEKNRPATFKHPFKSLASDWRMWVLWLLGRLPAELRRHGVANAS